MSLTLDLVQEDSSTFVALTMDSETTGIWPLYLSVSLRKRLNAQGTRRFRPFLEAFEGRGAVRELQTCRGAVTQGGGEVLDALEVGESTIQRIGGLIECRV